MSKLTVREFAQLHNITLPDLTSVLCPDVVDRPVLDFPVVWNARLKTRGGHMDFRRHEIHLNPLLNQNPTELRDTFLHELAHAIAGPFARHGPKWRATARWLGCNARRLHHHKSIFDNQKYHITCERCGPLGTRARPIRHRNPIHVGCGGKVSCDWERSKLERLMEQHLDF